MLEGLSIETLGVGGVVVAVIVGLILWKLLKLALKLALFVAVVIALVIGVGAYVKGGRAGLPLPDTSPEGRPGPTGADPTGSARR